MMFHFLKYQQPTETKCLDICLILWGWDSIKSNSDNTNLACYLEFPSHLGELWTPWWAAGDGEHTWKELAGPQQAVWPGVSQGFWVHGVKALRPLQEGLLLAWKEAALLGATVWICWEVSWGRTESIQVNFSCAQSEILVGKENFQLKAASCVYLL